MVITQAVRDANPMDALIYRILRRKRQSVLSASSFSPMQGLTTLTGFEPVLPP
jgi:hypothetical protein